MQYTRKEAQPLSSLTKQAIKQSFWELLEQRPLAQITVKDIVERCGINRNSFYYHFQDIPALIERALSADLWCGSSGSESYRPGDFRVRPAECGSKGPDMYH